MEAIMLARLVDVSPGGADAAVALTYQRYGERQYDAAFLDVGETIETIRDMLRALPHDDRERAVELLTRDLKEDASERACAALLPRPGG
jgi:DNA-binding GntR family transcriptional regulator